MATVKEGFSAPAAITCTLASLGSSGTVGRASTAVDNSTNLYLDALVTCTMTQAAGAVANDKAIYLYAYGSIDGSTYPEGITGTDAAYTILGAASALTTALRLIGVIPAVASDTNLHGPFAVAPAFGGILPPKWGILVLNYGGQTLTSGSLSYVGLLPTVA